jgi:hypothetical protein
MELPKIALLVVTLLGCGSDASSTTAPASSTQTIGPDGGSIVVGGATVTFPKNAVASATKITISEDDGALPAGFETLSHVFRCEPAGTTFSQPVTMQMPFTDDHKGAATIFWSTGADPTFNDIGGTVQNGTMVTTVQHFSSGFVGRRK